MKKTIIVGMIRIMRIILSLIYAAFKFIPVDKRKIIFLSRQSNELTLDFRLLKDELEKQDRNIKIVVVCCRVDDRKKGMSRFAIAIVRSMYHLATSSVCVIDSFWPAVSMLKHKKSLTVLQMWHALGAVKKFGYQTLEKESGRDRRIAEAMSMHRNYDYVIAGGTEWNKYYCEAFNITEDRILNTGLPRIDYLLKTEKINRAHILKKYPQFAEKPVILYAPTFRRNGSGSGEELLDMFDYNKYSIVVKNHPNQPLAFTNDNIYYCPEFTAIEMLSVCEYVITDYSAISLEAAILRKKTLYYLYDYDEYKAQNGLNVDPLQSMPECSCQKAEQIVNIINNGNYNMKELEAYRSKYLPAEMGRSAEKLASIICRMYE